MNATGRIEFWFDFGSNYSYLAAMRIEPLAAQHGLAIDWRPFLLGAIFRSFGWETSPFVLQRQKGDYVWKDMQRQCAKYRLAWRRPTVFPRGSVLAHRVALCTASEAWAGEFCRRIMTMNFAEDRDIESAEAVTLALAGLVDDPGAVIAKAQHDDNKLWLRRQTEEAAARGIFGAPTLLLAERCSGATIGSRTRWLRAERMQRVDDIQEYYASLE